MSKSGSIIHEKVQLCVLCSVSGIRQSDEKWRSYSIRKRSVNVPSVSMWQAHEQRFPCSLCRFVLGFVLSFYFLLEPLFHNPSQLHIHHVKLFSLQLRRHFKSSQTINRDTSTWSKPWCSLSQNGLNSATIWLSQFHIQIEVIYISTARTLTPGSQYYMQRPRPGLSVLPINVQGDDHIYTQSIKCSSPPHMAQGNILTQIFLKHDARKRKEWIPMCWHTAGLPGAVREILNSAIFVW